MFHNMRNPRDIIRLCIKTMHEDLKTYSDFGPSGCEADIFWNLERIKNDNKQGEALCGNASSWLQDYLPVFMKENGLQCRVFMVTSSVKNGCFHHFNMVKIEGMESMICDLTASQYFNHPLTALKGDAYFVGTRDELSEIVSTAQKNTENVIREAFPTLEFHSLWEIDFHYYNDKDFRRNLCDLLDKNTKESCLRTESFCYPMEITWGATRSHFLSCDVDTEEKGLGKAFQCADIIDLIEGKDAEIPNLVTCLSVQKFSLQDAPKIFAPK